MASGMRGRDEPVRPLRRKLERAARAIRRRQEAAVAPNFDGPLLGRMNSGYEFSAKTKRHRSQRTRINWARISRIDRR